METRSRSDERWCARRKSETRCRSNDAVEFAGGIDLNRLSREELGRDRGAVAERAKPVTEHAVFGRGRIGGGCETRVVIGVLMHRRRGVVVAVVGRVPAAQRTGQDQDDRQDGKRLRAKTQLTYTVTQGSGSQVVR